MLPSDLKEQLTIYQTFLTHRLDITQNSLTAYKQDIKQFDLWLNTADLSEMTELS